LQLLVEVSLGFALVRLKEGNQVSRDRQPIVLDRQSLGLDGLPPISMEQ